MQLRLWPVVLAVTCLSLAASAGDKAFKMMAPEKIQDGVRATLKRKMKDHSRDFHSLPMAVVLLNYAEVEKLSESLANEPRLDKAATGDGDDLTGLGSAFFVLQDQLRARAGELKVAAQKKDPKGMARSLGDLSNTCTGCHSMYRTPEPAAAPAPAPAPTPAPVPSK